MMIVYNEAGKIITDYDLLKGELRSIESYENGVLVERMVYHKYTTAEAAERNQPDRVTSLEEQLAQTDEVATSLFEVQAEQALRLDQADEAAAAQKAVNTQQDDAIAEIFDILLNI